MKYARFSGATLEQALSNASEQLSVEKASLHYTIVKDAKTGIFGIIPKQDMEIEVCLETKQLLSPEKIRKTTKNPLKTKQKNPVTNGNISSHTVDSTKHTRSNTTLPQENLPLHSDKDIEILSLLSPSQKKYTSNKKHALSSSVEIKEQEKNCSDTHSTPHKKKHSVKNVPDKKSLEESIVPLSEIPVSEREIALAIVREVVTKIVALVSSDASITIKLEDNSIYISIEENESTQALIGEDLEVLTAVQYIVYKIVTQHIRCLFSLYMNIGSAVVSEETLLINMITKLIEKVKNTQKSQRTYPLSAQQRVIAQQIIEQDPNIAIKPYTTEAPMQPVILTYVKEVPIVEEDIENLSE